jgi:ribonuclease HI
MEWKEEVVREVFREQDAEEIMRIRLPSKPTEDFISWFYEKSGLFSVRSAYKLARELKDVNDGHGKQSSSDNQQGRPLWKEFQKLPLPHKVPIFGWRAANNGLAVQSNKKRCKICITSSCEICGMEEESVMHALVRCGHASVLRSAMREIWDLPNELQLLNMTPDSLLSMVVEAGIDQGSKLLLLLWRTWYVRNKITHNSDKLSFVASVSFLQKFWEELCDVRQQSGIRDTIGKKPVVVSLCAGKQGRTREQTTWEPPPHGWIKVNVDGAFDQGSGVGGVGVIIRNAKAEVLMTTWKYTEKGTSAEEVEALACREGLLLATKFNQGVILETDCGPIAAMLEAKSAQRSYLKFIVDEAIEAGSNLTQWQIVHKRRESNVAAHELAQLAKRTKHSAVWRFAAPVCVEPIVARECNCVSE